MDRATTHRRFGWWALLVFVLLGLGLEGLHGFKVRWYLDEANETRRLLFTLAHAHGVLLALVNVIFGLSLAQAAHDERWVRFGSPALLAATVLLPAGFFLGGVWTYGGDPGPGGLISPVGAVLMVLAAFAIARSAR